MIKPGFLEERYAVIRVLEPEEGTANVEDSSSAQFRERTVQLCAVAVLMNVRRRRGCRRCGV